MSIFGKKTEDKTKKTSAVAAKPVKTEAKSMKDLYGATPAVKGGKKAVPRQAYGNAYKILVKPLVTEKVSNLSALNKYVFQVAPETNKLEVAKAIKEI